MAELVVPWSPLQLAALHEALDDYGNGILLDKLRYRTNRRPLQLGIAYLTPEYRLQFPSPLHQCIVAHRLCKAGHAFKATEFDEVLDAVIARMDFQRIQQDLGRRPRFGDRVEPERPFQVEFKSGGAKNGRGGSSLPARCGVRLQSRRLPRLYLNSELRWGVDIARDSAGTDLAERVARFSADGRYQHILLDEKAVVNFVTVHHYAEHSAVLDLEWKVVYEPTPFGSSA